MADRPILFSGPMVRALLAGTKTQTRRIIQADSTRLICPACCCGEKAWKQGEHRADCPGTLEWLPVKLPRVAVGDRLYVRERIERAGYGGEAVGYPADGSWLPNTPWKWKGKSLPSIHMPRWASRITLYVTGVRIERLQDISPEDAQAEGVDRRSRKVRMFSLFGADAEERARQYLQACVWEYEELWDQINGPGSWEANPWVVAYTFIVASGNIDSLPGAAYLAVGSE